MNKEGGEMSVANQISRGPSRYQGEMWLVGGIVPIAFRRKVLRSGPVTEVQRTDGTPGNWTI